MACCLLARVLLTGGGAEQALPLLDEARELFEAVEQSRPGCGAARMASACFTDKATALLPSWAASTSAAAAYEEAIRRDQQRGDARDVAVGKDQLGTVRMRQRRYPEALAAYAEARERFTQLDEPGIVAVHLASDRQRVSGGQASRKRRRMPTGSRSRSRCNSEMLAGQAATLFNWGFSTTSARTA